MRHWLIGSVSVLAMAIMLTGCGSSQEAGDNEAQAQVQAEESAEPAIPIPQDSPMAKIKPGMGRGQVVSILGEPDHQYSHVTGKAFIPYFFGGDQSRTVAHYKGLGRIIFSQDHSFTSNMSVNYIEYDPDEPGFPE